MNDGQIIFENVSLFYGEVLGVNRVTLGIPPGITSLVGPNGSGKTTLMNLMAGLVRPSHGSVRVLGISPDQPEKLMKVLGYATQFDSFPRGFTGFDFINCYLKLFGYSSEEARDRAQQAIRQVRLEEAAGRRIAGYSKGMRQRIKLAQAIAHDPRVLVLDEPLNGLDPLVRAQTIEMFRQFAAQGRHVIVSSHVLHEVDMISDHVVMLSSGYVVAEGKIQNVRREIRDKPMQVLVRCDQPRFLASRLFESDGVLEARLLPDNQGILIKTRDPDHFFDLLNKLAVDQVQVDRVWPADDDVNSVYGYLIEGPGARGS